jgi:hypothetical protein
MGCGKKVVFEMTPEEQQLLGGLIDRIQKTQLTEKDPDAEQLILQGLGRSPDALYVLAQTVLVQNFALEQAQAQIRQLQQQQQQPAPAKATSFLGSLLGHHDPPPPPAPSYPPTSSYPTAYPPQQQQGWQQVPSPPPQYGNPGYAYPAPVSGGGSFLRSAATTAAGVAAGALAFEGIESLFHGGFGGGGYGGGFGGGGFERPIEETVVNNYYDDPNSGGRELHGEHPASFDDRGNGPTLEDAGYETRGDSNDLDTSDNSSDLDDSSFNDPGDDPGDSSDFSSDDDQV